MSFSILVATPTAAFGDLISNSLEESGEFKVDVVHTALEAHESLGKHAYCIAVLDSDLENNGMRCLAEELNASHPDIKLVLIPPGNNPSHPLMDGLACNAYLRKPFYLPDLIELMGELSAGGFGKQAELVSSSNWLKSADLEGLIEATGARAALVSHPDGTAVFGGILPEGAHGELLELAGRFWQRPVRSDLVRFVRLKGDEQDTLLYLTAVLEKEETGLVLLYPVPSPLSKVRGQAGVFVRGLRDLAMHPHLQPEKITLTPLSLQKVVETDKARDPFLDCLGEEDEPETDALRNFNLAEILGAIPSPDPNSNSSPEGADIFGDDWLPEMTAASQPGWTDAGDGGRHSEFARESGFEMAAAEGENSGLGFEGLGLDADAAVVDEPSLSWGPELDETFPGMLPLDFEALTGAAMAEDPIFNQPLPKSEDEGSLKTYTCVLIPRNPQQYLTRELSERVSQWVRQLCLSQDWRLEGISLRPEYLQWTIQTSAFIDPGSTVQMVRQHTSDLIYSQFERLREQNPSGDFWANEPLILNGSQPPSAQLLRDSISQARSPEVRSAPGGDTPTTA